MSCADFFAQIEKRSIDVEIKNDLGEVIFTKSGFEVPTFWDDRAATIMANKYAAAGENSAFQIFGRVVAKIVEWGNEQGYFSNDVEKDDFETNLADILINQRGCFNSPALFNLGVKGHFSQCSACFVLDVEDNMESILEYTKREGMIFKWGSGAGVNVSNLRGKGEKLSSGGTSSGVLSFLGIWDHAAGVIRSGGSLRRAAVLICLDVDHPEIEDFIECKTKEEIKALILYNNGISKDEAFSTVAFQNENHSVRVTDKFMLAVKNDEDWDLINRTDKAVRKVKAKDLYRKLCKCAHEIGDPGIMFHDRTNLDNPVPSLGEIVAANPCLSGDTELMTVDGFMKVSDLSKLDFVNFIDNLGNVVTGKAWSNGYKNTVKVSFYNKVGSVVCTEDHRFMLNDGSVSFAKDLSGKRLKPFIAEKSITKTDPLIAGFIQGDGNLGRIKSLAHKGLEVNIGMKDLEIAALFTGELNKELSDRKIYSREAMQVANKYSLCAEVLPKRILSDVVMDLTKKDLSDFLCGLYSANGSIINVGRVAYKTTCLDLANQLVNILSKFDIYAYITTNKPLKILWSNGEYTSKESYDVNIANFKGIVKFAKEINFIQEYKREALRAVINKLSPKVSSVKPFGNEEVFDFSIPSTNWGCVSIGEEFIAVVHNCGEFAYINNSACNLSSLNLVKYLDKDLNFNYEKFGKDVKVLITAMDIVINPAHYPEEKIANMSKKTRPLGLGFTNLGAMLMMKGLAYSSQEARSLASCVTHNMTKFAYEMSIDLAKKLGSFEAFEENKETCQNIAERLVGVSVSEEIGKYGLRNSQVTLLAPTGTISFIMSCDTTSLEPLFAQKSYKNLVGGGVMEIIPPCVQFAKDRYGDDASCLSTVGNLHWRHHVDMMAACQKHLNSAISKTLNLPNSATIDEVGNIYMYAWEQGLKSVTVYRDGSKVGQPLTMDKAVEQGVGTIENSTVLGPTNEIKRGVRQRLNDTRYGPNHKFNIGGFEGYILTGTYPDGQLGEIFIKTSKTGSTIDGLLDSFAISISTALQYGVPLEVLIDKFKDSKFTPSGITTNKEIQLCSSIMDYLFRWLEQNFKDKCCCKSGECACAEECACKAEEVSKVVFNEEVSLHGELCSICGSFTQRTGKCFTCINCGTTTSCG